MTGERRFATAPNALEEELHRRLRRIWDETEDHDEARSALVSLAADLAPKHADLAEWLEVEGQETFACFHFPKERRRRIRTTNGNERVNQEPLRRSRLVRIFEPPRVYRRAPDLSPGSSAWVS